MAFAYRSLCLVFLACFMAGCTASQHVTRNIKDSSTMTRVILKALPPGTPLEKAAQFMTDQGFVCSYVQNESFMDRNNIDYVYCCRTDSGELVKRKWFVAIVVVDGRVIEILADTGLVGL